MFNKDSALVKIWVDLIMKENPQYTRDNIPNIHNLREVVLSIVGE